MTIARNLRIEALEDRLNFSVAGGAIADAVAGSTPVQDILLRRTRPQSIQWTAGSAATSGTTVVNMSTTQLPVAAPVTPEAPPKLRIYRPGALGSSTATGTQSSEMFSDTVQTTVVPVTPIAPAAPTSDPRYTQQGPVQGITWSATPAGGLANLSTMQWVTNESDPKAVAAQTLQMPAGRSGLLLWDMANGLAGNPLDAFQTPDGTLTGLASPFMTNGVQAVKAQAETFFSALAANGAHVDFVILDWEVCFASWSYTDAQKATILADPRTKALLASVGVDPTVNMNWSKYDTAVGNLLNQELNQAIFDVVKKYFPNAITSNYGSTVMSATYAVPDCYDNSYIDLSHSGTTNSPELYGNIGQGLARAQLTPGVSFGNSGYSALLWEINTVRATMLSSPDGVVPWIAYQNYTSSLQNNPYYQEMIYQAALSGVKDFLLWNPVGNQPGDNPADYSSDAQTELVDQTLSDINAHLGTGPRTVVTTSEMSWNSGVVASGVQEGNQVIWRVSAPEGATAIKVVQTGQILSLNGGVGLWYTSTAGDPIDFVAI